QLTNPRTTPLPMPRPALATQSATPTALRRPVLPAPAPVKPSTPAPPAAPAPATLPPSPPPQSPAPSATKPVAEEPRGEGTTPPLESARTQTRLLASAGTDGVITFWDLGKNEQAARLRAANRDVLSLAFSPEGRFLVSGGLDETVQLWDVATGKE